MLLKQTMRFLSFRVFPLLMVLSFLVVAKNASGAVTDLWILDIEVTQATQCLDMTSGYKNCPNNSLELDGDRKVAVRVYIGHKGGSTCPNNNNFYQFPELKGAKVKLRWAAAHAPDYIFPIGYSDEKSFDVPCSTKLNELREDAKGSVTFIIPTDKLGKPGFERALWVEAEVVAPSGVTDDPNNNKKDTQLGGKDAQGKSIPGGLFPHEPVTVKWIPINYRPNKRKDPKDPDYTGPQWVDFKQPVKVAAYMETLFPMPVYFSMYPAYFYYGPDPETNAPCTTCPDIRDKGGDDELFAKLKEAFIDMKAGKITYGDVPDVLVGYLPDEADILCRGQGGFGGVAWLTGCGGGSVEYEILAHEVAHGLSVWHPDDNVDEPCWPYPGDYAIQETGYSFLNDKPITSTAVEFMKTPATGSKWISPYMWNRLLDKAVSPEWSKCDSKTFSYSMFALMPDEVLSLQPQPAILVSGRVYASGEGELRPMYQFASEGPFPVSDPAGDYCLDFQDSGGSSQLTHCFDLPHYQPINGNGSPSGNFAFVLPLPSQTEQILLMEGSTVLDEVVATPHAPKVISIAISAAKDPSAISWTAADQDGDSLWYALQYSPDGGNSFFPMAIDLEGTGPVDLEIDSSRLAGSQNAVVRVRATDGFKTNAAESLPFKVTFKDPNVVIYAPLDDTVIAYRDTLVLLGHAQDMEDGELGGLSLTWSSDSEGFLGNGSEVVLAGETLSLGKHEITLTATDSHGRTGTATIIVNVALPVVVDIKPESEPASINLKSRGVIPVALVTTDDFDATDVMPSTVELAGARPVRWTKEDVHNDSDIDMLFHFKVQHLNLDMNSTEATLTGNTKKDVPVLGTDTVNIVPAAKRDR